MMTSKFQCYYHGFNLWLKSRTVAIIIMVVVVTCITIIAAYILIKMSLKYINFEVLNL